MLVLSAVTFVWTLSLVTAKLHDVVVSPDCVFSPARAEGRHGDTIAFTSAADHLVHPSAGQGRSSLDHVAQVPSLFEVPASGTTHAFFCGQPGSPGRNTFIFTARDGGERSLPMLWGVGAAVAVLFVIALCGGCCMYQRRADRRNRRAAAANPPEVEMQLPKYQPRSQTGEVVLQPDLGRTPTYTSPESVPVVIVRSESPVPIVPETTTASAGRVMPLRQRTK